MKKVLALALVAILSIALPVSADELLVWDFEGNAGSELVVFASGVHPGLQTTSITRGPGLSPAPGANRFNARFWSPVFSPDDFYSFSIAPEAGFTYSLSALSWESRRSNSGPEIFELWSFTDGSSTLHNSGFANGNHTFTFGGLDGLSSETEFRIYAFGSSSSLGTYSLDNIVLHGVVSGVEPVPEPTTLALLGVGAVGLYAAHRRKKAKA